MRQERKSTLLRHISESQGMTRNELADSLNLNMTVLIRLVSELIEQGVVYAETHYGTAARGRPVSIIRLNPKAAYTLGLEFGRNHLMLVLLDATGTVLAWEKQQQIPAFMATQEVLDSLLERLDRFLQKHKASWSQTVALGLALHDVVDAQGVWFTQYATGKGFEVKAYMSQQLGRSVVVEDVSRSFAYAEYHHGAGQGQADMLYVFLGSHGVGGGIFVNNALLKSSSGVCGELGHIVVNPEGKQCHCGSQGCLETVATHHAIEARFRALVDQGVGTTVDSQSATFFSICQAAARGDKAAYLVLDELAEFMGQALAAAINISGAPRVIVGGQLQQAGESFLRTLEVSLRRRVVAPLLKDIRVCYAALAPYAGAWGAGLMALEQSLGDGSFIELCAKMHKKGEVHVLQTV